MKIPHATRKGKNVQVPLTPCAKRQPPRTDRSLVSLAAKSRSAGGVLPPILGATHGRCAVAAPPGAPAPGFLGFTKLSQSSSASCGVVARLRQ